MVTTHKPLHEHEVATYYRRDNTLYEVVKIDLEDKARDIVGSVRLRNITAPLDQAGSTYVPASRLAASYVAVEAAA